VNGNGKGKGNGNVGQNLKTKFGKLIRWDLAQLHLHSSLKPHLLAPRNVWAKHYSYDHYIIHLEIRRLPRWQGLCSSEIVLPGGCRWWPERGPTNLIVYLDFYAPFLIMACPHPGWEPLEAKLWCSSPLPPSIKFSCYII
jgi:hypothetical protein